MSSEVNDALTALNWLHGPVADKPAPPPLGVRDFSTLPRCQKDVIERVSNSVRSFRPPGPAPTRHEAAAELLALGRSYSPEDPTTVVPYQPQLASLPDGSARAVPMETVLAGEARKLLVEFDSRLLRTQDGVAFTSQRDGPLSLYKDHHLRFPPSIYVSFIRRLVEAGIMSFTRSPLSRVTPFFVEKKNNRQRLVLDCRGVNRLFRKAPSMELGAGYCLSELTVPNGESLFISQGDIKDCFYERGLPHELCRYFAFDPIKGNHAMEWGIQGVEGQQVSGNESLSPILRVCPMGWNWAFWFVQAAHIHVLEEQGFHQEIRLRDFAPAPTMTAESPPISMPYCDNLTVLGLTADRVERSREKVSDAFKQYGFLMHEETPAELDA